MDLNPPQLCVAAREVQRAVDEMLKSFSDHDMCLGYVRDGFFW